jgi:bifunctional DNase/RNase
MIPVVLARILIDEASDRNIIILREKEGARTLPIWIGLPEIRAIYLHVNQQVSPRPMTHDLMADLLQKTGGKLEWVLIDKFISEKGGGTFHAKLRVKVNGKTVDVDARPSDAVALAVRTNAALFTQEDVLEAVGIPTLAEEVKGAEDGAEEDGSEDEEAGEEE